MEKNSILATFAEIRRAFVKAPARTALILGIILVAFLSYDALSAYVQKVVTEAPEGMDISKQENKNTLVSTSSITLIPKRLQESNRSYEADFEYPYFAISVLDKEVQKVLQEKIEEVKYTELSDGLEKNGVGGHYEAPYIDLHLVSFKMFFCNYVTFLDSDLDSRCSRTASGFNFDLRLQRLLTLDDALQMIGMDLEDLSEASRKQLKKDASIFLWDDGKGFEPISKNFSAFAITGDTITFIFQQMQVGPAMAGTPEVSFPRID